MSRTNAKALVLVNWKGVFYERYLLDRQVTALEGANGAGKTTVMIAAYVVLLPDMSRLRFTNLGETGATGGDKGIWGRLGEPGRPSWAVMEFEARRDERLVAGVRLERKGEPTVEPTPFMVTGLAEDVRLQDLMLVSHGDHDMVPEMSELRENAARLGGVLKVFSTAKDYFGALFDHGVTPMRLSNDTDRNKLNEMLKTSMTGGMSRGLLSELRTFLLKEESGLAETLQRMRNNLDSCRRTRTEVQEAQRLEREIGAVLEAGEAMFAAAVTATRKRASEMADKVASREQAVEKANQAREEASRALNSTKATLDECDRDKALLEPKIEATKDHERRVRGALQWADAVRVRAEENDRAVAEHDEATTQRDGTQARLERCEADLEGARETRDNAGAGLADLQKGLDELHRRADGHRRVLTKLNEARAGLDEPTLPAERAVEAMPKARVQLEKIDHERRALNRRIDDAVAHRSEHARALDALRVLHSSSFEVSEAHAVAKAALIAVQRWRDLGSREKEIREQLAQAAALTKRQTKARELADQLDLPPSNHEGPRRVRDALDAVEAELRGLDDARHEAERDEQEAARELQTLRQQIETLERRAAQYQVACRHVARLANSTELEITDGASLQEARARLALATGQQRLCLAELSQEREDLLRAAQELKTAGGSLDPELLRLQSRLGAELLVHQLDDQVSIEEAAEVEAVLGPLAHALVVDDLDEALDRMAGRGDGPPSVLIISDEMTPSFDPERRLGAPDRRDVVVTEGEVTRVTRVPKAPTLGRAARERRADELRERASSLEPEISRIGATLRALEGAGNAVEALMPLVEIWLTGDPAGEIEQSKQAVAAAEERRLRARAQSERTLTTKRDLAPRLTRLKDLLPDATLIDPPDHADRAGMLRRDLDAAKKAVAALARVGEAPARLEDHLDALRDPPLDERELEQKQTELGRLIRRRDALADGIEAAIYVAEHQEALTWSDAEGRLREEEALVPALKEQHQQAVDACKAAAKNEGRARDALKDAVARWNEADAQRRSAGRQLDDARGSLQETGILNPSRAMLEEVEQQLHVLERRLAELAKQQRALLEDVGKRRTTLETAENTASEARDALRTEQDQARPNIEAWEHLQPELAAMGLEHVAHNPRYLERFEGQPHISLWGMAAQEHTSLVERLKNAQRGDEILARVQSRPDTWDQRAGLGYMQAWLMVRSWLLRRLPAHIAEGDDPLEALAKLKDEMAGLEERLARQESDLRGASADVAQGIDVQIRKAYGQVRRLNKHLASVSFGSIRRVRVTPKRVDRMEQLLRALREGAAQELLFQEAMPVEEALQEIFRRFGGGRMGGTKLLDYREYLNLQVEVQRNERQEWEIANPTRLSTGEAIGVGAALMMVVLTEWERNANQFRGRRDSGCLRFLFLDEANRLDHANLGMLFELCHTLELQLLVAAPEVERAEGCTVYRLVRTRSKEGLEQVMVSGRRVVGEA